MPGQDYMMGAEQSIMQYDTLFFQNPHPEEFPAWSDAYPLSWSSLASSKIRSLLSSFDSCISDKEDSDYEADQPQEGQRRWRLQLPIHGQIALRRAIKNGEDVFDIERKQRSNWVHEYVKRYGPLRDINVAFKDVDWTSEIQPVSKAAKVADGAGISPGSVPTVEEMSILEYLSTFRSDQYDVREDFEDQYDWDDEEEYYGSMHSGDELEEDPFADLLEHNYWARRGSDLQTETWFQVNPFEGWPASA